MRKMKFCDYEEFACDVLNKMDEIVAQDEFNDIAIVAKYEEARKIIASLLCMGCDLHSVELHDKCWDNYTDEYIISVTNIHDGDYDDEYDDEAYELWCEPLRRENGYINDVSKVTYIFDNCSSKVIPHCKAETVYEVSVEESECDDEDCGGECCCDCCGDKPECEDLDTSTSESTYVSRDKDGTPTGFQKSWFTDEDGVSCYSSYTHYSNNVDMLREIAEKFGVKL